MNSRTQETPVVETYVRPRDSACRAASCVPAVSTRGGLILNADDWGRDAETSRKIMACVLAGSVSSVSAMVFMNDSEPAANVARERKVDAGLHLNFTSGFSGRNLPHTLVAHQEKIGRHLLRHKFASAFFDPRLVNSFEYVTRSQIEEYHRLYGHQPLRVDGHHHMHLCANVLCSQLIPRGTIVRRNFSFRKGQRSPLNRLYRRAIDTLLKRRYRLSDFFFSIVPFDRADRLAEIMSLSREFIVEVETHPVNQKEFEFLTEGGIFRFFDCNRIASSYFLGNRGIERS